MSQAQTLFCTRQPPLLLFFWCPSIKIYKLETTTSTSTWSLDTLSLVASICSLFLGLWDPLSSRRHSSLAEICFLFKLFLSPLLSFFWLLLVFQIVTKFGCEKPTYTWAQVLEYFVCAMKPLVEDMNLGCWGLRKTRSEWGIKQLSFAVILVLVEDWRVGGGGESLWVMFRFEWVLVGEGEWKDNKEWYSAVERKRPKGLFCGCGGVIFSEILLLNWST